MAISSIDELLMGGPGNSQQPKTSEYEEAPEPIEELEQEPESQEYDDDVEEIGQDDSGDEGEHENEEPEEKPRKKEAEVDEYGNEKEPENEVIRERLARQARKHEAEINALRAQLAQQGASQDVQKAAKDFEYDPEASGDWQQQLASFVKQTVNSMGREQEEAQMRQQEDRAQAEFREKFSQGMQKFDDFVDVVDSQPIDHAMTMALRGIADPAAFIYAAAKRNPHELERISKLRDPYARMVEMGKLEERMRKNKPMTKAPRPLARTQEDATTKVKTKEKNTGDDLLAKADAKRLSAVRTRLKGNR
jgi:hypothetical protein